MWNEEQFNRVSDQQQQYTMEANIFALLLH